ncbi:MAG: D-aminoacylase [Candidatus Thermoplasmatota archaeon]|nr:D-aminoacylase [Candidatus Thermoplasmatota archaeon]
MHDMLIAGGTLVDGTGAKRIPRDIAIDGHKISGVYKHSEAKAKVLIDATDMVVCPGFIDIHSHSELHLLANPFAESKIRQGVTTELVGNCGGSPAPALGMARESLLDFAKQLDIDVDWSTLDEYLLRLSNLTTSVNVACLVGATNLRASVMGNRDARPSEEQMFQMKHLLADAMLQGAFGLSSGLIYAPGCYADTDELVDLASVSASLGGFYASHIRGEGRTLLKAVAEALEIGRRARTRVQISHHKACGRSCWGNVRKTMMMIEEARRSGVDVGFDVYPYTASCTSLDTILPPWAREGSKEDIITRLKDPLAREKAKEQMTVFSDEWEAIAAEDGWENICVIGLRSDKYRPFENRSVSDIALELGRDPSEVALDLMIDEDLMAGAVFHEMSEEDVASVLAHPLASIGSDGEAEAPYGIMGETASHPRAYGTFPRVLRHYALDAGLITLEEAIRKMTSLPAERIGLKDRGLVARGMRADIVIFDPQRVRDKATFDDSHAYPEGIDYVLVNGIVTIDHGKHTRERAGQVLRHSPSVC